MPARTCSVAICVDPAEGVPLDRAAGIKRAPAETILVQVPLRPLWEERDMTDLHELHRIGDEREARP